jgi:hypothetical protein
LKSIDLYNGNTASLIDNIDLWWEGKEIVVEVSLNGTSWTPAVKGERLPIIPQGFDPANKTLHLRVLFAENEDESYLTYLRVRAYLSDEGLYENRIIEYTNAVLFDEQNPSDLPNQWGAVLDSGTLTIKTDAISQTPMSVKTVEVWLKKKTSTNPTLSTNLSSATTYINGVAGTTHISGEWVVKHFVNAGGISGDIVISGDVQVGKVAIYPTAFSAGQIATLVSNYTGRYKTSYNGTAPISISEPADSTTIYAHEWAFSTS